MCPFLDLQNKFCLYLSFSFLISGAPAAQNKTTNPGAGDETVGKTRKYEQNNAHLCEAKREKNNIALRNKEPLKFATPTRTVISVVVLMPFSMCFLFALEHYVCLIGLFWRPGRAQTKKELAMEK